MSLTSSGRLTRYLIARVHSRLVEQETVRPHQGRYGSVLDTTGAARFTAASKAFTSLLQSDH